MHEQDGRFGGPVGRMHWRHRMTERWNQMTPEERDKFIEGMKCSRFGSSVAGSAT